MPQDMANSMAPKASSLCPIMEEGITGIITITDTMGIMDIMDTTDTTIIIDQYFDVCEYIGKKFGLKYNNFCGNIYNLLIERLQILLKIGHRNKLFLRRYMTDQYSVKAIIGRRVNMTGQIQYLIHWQGYDEKQSTWQPVRNLTYVKEMLKEYDMKHGINSKLKRQEPVKNNTHLQDPPVEENGDQLEIIKEKKKCTTKVKKEHFDTKNDEKPSKAQRLIRKKQTKAQNAPKQIISYKCKVQPQNSTDNLKQCAEQATTQQQKMKSSESTEHGQRKDQLKIIGMCQDKDHQYLFLVENNVGLRSFKPHEYMIKQHATSLISFYESNIKFNNCEQV